MTFLIKCIHKQGLEIISLGIFLKFGEAFDCPERIYTSNQEIINHVRVGKLSKTIKSEKKEKKGLAVNNRKGAPNYGGNVTQTTSVSESVDLDALTDKLMEKLSGLLSPELLAQAIANKLPQAQGAVQQEGSNPRNIQQEELTFIPSKIISEEIKSSSSMASESSEEDNNLSEALSALRAMRKAKKK